MERFGAILQIVEQRGVLACALCVCCHVDVYAKLFSILRIVNQRGVPGPFGHAPWDEVSLRGVAQLRSLVPGLGSGSGLGSGLGLGLSSGLKLQLQL